MINKKFGKKVMTMALSLAMVVTSVTYAPKNVEASVTLSGGNSGWNMVWCDEFDQTVGSGVDANTWNYDTGHGSNGWGNNEVQNYTTSTNNVYIANVDGALDGKALAIKAKREGGEITSGRLRTDGKFYGRYGSYEARIKMENGMCDGVWPAFWMMGNNTGLSWPDCGEIDIMEHRNLENNIIGTLHWGIGIGNDGHNYSGSETNNSYGYVDTMDEWHTYAVDWFEDGMKFYVDGSCYETLNTSVANNQEEFNKAHYLLLNLAIGSTSSPFTISKTVPNDWQESTMYVDYVRVYQGDDNDFQRNKTYQPEVATVETTTEDPNGHWINIGEGYSYNSNKVNCNVVNIQQPGFAHERGIYVNVPAGISEVTINGNAQTEAIDGAGVVLYLSNLSQNINEVVIKHGLGTSSITIKNVNGTQTATTAQVTTTAQATTQQVTTQQVTTQQQTTQNENALKWTELYDSKGTATVTNTSTDKTYGARFVGFNTDMGWGGNSVWQGQAKLSEIQVKSGSKYKVSFDVDASPDKSILVQYLSGEQYQSETYNTSLGHIEMTKTVSDNELELVLGFGAVDDSEIGTYDIEISNLKIEEVEEQNTTAETVTQQTTTQQTTTQQVTTQAAGSYDWKALGNGIGEGGNGFYYDKNSAENVSFVNVQKPGWTAEAGIYSTYPSVVQSVEVNGVELDSSCKQGTGALIYLSALNKRINSVTVNYGSGVVTFFVKNENIEEQQATKYTVTVDGVSTEYDENAVVQLPNDGVGYYEVNENAAYKPDEEITVTKDYTFNKFTVTPSIESGAAIRVNEEQDKDSAGFIRFKAAYAVSNSAAYNNTDIFKAGMLITTKSAFDSNENVLSIGSERAVNILNESSAFVDAEKSFYCALSNIKSTGYAKKYIAKSYVLVNFHDGDSAVVYSQGTSNTEGRSIAQVAALIKASGYGSYTTEKQREYIDYFASFNS